MRRLLTVLAIALLGCAGGPRPDAATSPRVRPPEMLSRVRPDLRPPTGIPVEGRVLDVRVEVLIDSAGRPDMRTLRLTGLGAAENSNAIAQWIEASRFRPAQQGGRAVAGVYRMRFEARAVRRRIS